MKVGLSGLVTTQVKAPRWEIVLGTPTRVPCDWNLDLRGKSGGDKAGKESNCKMADVLGGIAGAFSWLLRESFKKGMSRQESDTGDCVLEVCSAEWPEEGELEY